METIVILSYSFIVFACNSLNAGADLNKYGVPNLYRCLFPIQVQKLSWFVLLCMIADAILSWQRSAAYSKEETRYIHPILTLLSTLSLQVQPNIIFGTDAANLTKELMREKKKISPYKHLCATHAVCRSLFRGNSGACLCRSSLWPRAVTCPGPFKPNKY